MATTRTTPTPRNQESFVNNHHKPAQISPEFKAELEKELVHLRDVVCPVVANRLKGDREGGDITDNAAFEQAKEELARLLSRASEIEQTLREATIMTTGGKVRRGPVAFGSLVTVSRDDGKTLTYRIVSSIEASPTNGKISDESPIGRALVGKKRGETVSVQAPSRLYSYTITEIQ
jgi:transcription elongation factor GreA